MFHDKTTIGDKLVYIVESHQSVLEPWAEIRRSRPTAPALITLDHHTDTNAPFNSYRFHTAGASHTDQAIAKKEALLPEMIAALRYEDEASVQKAIVLLKNDEHITTALEAGILSRAFVIHHLFNRPVPRLIYCTTASCTVECQKVDHSDCQAKHSAQMLESVYLERALADLNGKAQNDGVSAVETEPYILDIDLDYFHAETSIEPANTSTFYRLVRNAVAVTIAKEPTYVLSCRDEGSAVSAAMLLERMKQHIEAAMM